MRSGYNESNLVSPSKLYFIANAPFRRKFSFDQGMQSAEKRKFDPFQRGESFAASRQGS